MTLPSVCRTEQIARMAGLVEQPSFDLGYSNPLWTPPKAAKPAEQTDQGSNVDTLKDGISPDELPPVISPPERDLAAEVRELLAPVTEYLSGFAVVEKRDDFERGYSDPLGTSKPPAELPSAEQQQFEVGLEELRSQVRTLGDSLVKYLTHHRNWSIATLTAAHEEAVAAVEAQKAVLAEAEDEQRAQVALHRHAKEERGRSYALVAACEARKPDQALSKRVAWWSWEYEHRRLTARLAHAQTEEEAARAELGRRARNVGEQKRKLATLNADAREKYAKLSGRETVDAATGLRRPAEV